MVEITVYCTNIELSPNDQSNTNHQLVSAFNSAVEVYEGFCSLKQVDLQFKITHGSSVQKVLLEEAKLYDASKVILGSSKHNAIRYDLPKLLCQNKELGLKFHKRWTLIHDFVNVSGLHCH